MSYSYPISTITGPCQTGSQNTQPSNKETLSPYTEYAMESLPFDSKGKQDSGQSEYKNPFQHFPIYELNYINSLRAAGLFISPNQKNGRLACSSGCQYEASNLDDWPVHQVPNRNAKDKRLARLPGSQY